MPEPTSFTEVTTPDELRALLGEIAPRAVTKNRPHLHARDKEWLAASPFCLIATSDASGRCDVSPKGDPPGFTKILDDTTLAIPERLGNRRADGYHNILSNPHVWLIYLIPGRTDTLRINGRARLVREAAFFDQMIVKGHRPALALIVEIEEVFFHCAKAFLRSSLWKPETWHPDALPSRAVIVKTAEAPPDSLEELERFYGPGYESLLYGQRKHE